MGLRTAPTTHVLHATGVTSDGTWLTQPQPRISHTQASNRTQQRSHKTTRDSCKQGPCITHTALQSRAMPQHNTPFTSGLGYKSTAGARRGGPNSAQTTQRLRYTVRNHTAVLQECTACSLCCKDVLQAVLQDPGTRPTPSHPDQGSPVIHHNARPAPTQGQLPTHTDHAEVLHLLPHTVYPTLHTQARARIDCKSAASQQTTLGTHSRPCYQYTLLLSHLANTSMECYPG